MKNATKLKKAARSGAQKAKPAPVKTPQKKRVVEGMHRRDYKAASVDRFTSDWLTPRTSGDAEIYKALIRLRARSRDLERSDPYIRKFLKELLDNVWGPSGPQLQPNVQTAGGAEDSKANVALKKAWKEWTKRGCCIQGYNWKKLNRLALRTTARDGDDLIQFIRGKAAGNKNGFALRLLEPDYLDEYYYAFQRLPNGNQIRMGVEVDANHKPVAYHILQNHPGDYLVGDYLYSQGKVVLPAADVIHCAVIERIDQSRGVPWITAAIPRLRHLDGYQESAVIAARVAADKMGFFKRTVPEGWAGEQDDDGNPIMPSEPGSFEVLPMGYDITTVDFANPNAQYGPFVKETLKAVASALCISYPTLASDLEAVNYSSMRAGTLSERDMWMVLQAWWIEEVVTRIWEEWLKMSLMMGAIPGYGLQDFDRLNANVTWFGRRWTWVDPSVEVDAETKAINAGLKSRRQSIAERTNQTLDQVDDEQARDAKSAAASGLIYNDAYKQELAAYQSAVMAGVVTPCLEDEQYFREKYGMPPASPEVIAAWTKGGGTRRPQGILPESAGVPGGQPPPGEKPPEPKEPPLVPLMPKDDALEKMMGFMERVLTNQSAMIEKLTARLNPDHASQPRHPQSGQFVVPVDPGDSATWSHNSPEELTAYNDAKQLLASGDGDPYDVAKAQVLVEQMEWQAKLNAPQSEDSFSDYDHAFKELDNHEPGSPEWQVLIDQLVAME